MAQGSSTRIDVLVLTAAKGEDEALLAVEEGAHGAWRDGTLEDPSRPYRVREFRLDAGGTIRVAHVHARKMGETTAATVATRYIAELKPRVLAMCGVCAGRPDWVGLGDVVVAESIFKYDAGEVERAEAGAKARFRSDGGDRPLPRVWRDRAEEFGAGFAETEAGSALLAGRPWPLEHVELWMLDLLDRGEDPTEALPANVSQEAFALAIDRLRERRLISRKPGTLSILKKGRSQVADVRLRHGGTLPEPRAWTLHVAAFATGSKLQRDVKVWNKIKDTRRLVHALDMEGAAVAEAGWHEGIDPTLVVKGVMDFADPDRPQHARAFAARASAEVLLAFLRAHVQPAGRTARDVLKTGIAERPENATNPGSLLHPRYRVVEFFDETRVRELGDLESWCDDAAPLAARLFVGPGGTGKTRLMLEWAARLRERGWNAGFVSESVDPHDLELVLGAAEPTFVIVDYAEARTDLLDLVKRVAEREQRGRLRVVLLAREVADWWKRLRHSDSAVEGLLRAHEPSAISPVPVDGELRDRLFERSVAAFAPVLGAAAPPATPDLGDNRFGRVLYVAMAALAALERRPIRAESILEDTVQRERRYWTHRFGAEIGGSGEAVEDFETATSRFMAAVTMRGGVPRGEPARDLLERARGPDVGHLLDWLATAYPLRDPESDKVRAIAPVEPDLLGEQLVQDVLEHHDTPARFVEAVFEGAGPEELRSGFLVLGRLGARGDAGGDVGKWIEQLIGGDPEATAGPALTAILTLRSETAHAPIGPQLARALEEVGGSAELAGLVDGLLPPEEPSVSLRELWAWASRRLLDALPESDSEESHVERARLSNKLGNRLGELGRREAALAAAEEAVAIYRELATARPDAFLPDLASSLNNLGNRLGELGRREAALAAAEEAVAIYRELATARPDAFLPDLALSLNNLGASLSELGRREAALAAAEEAVATYRELATARPDAFLPYLAMSLNNLGNQLSELGRREAALAAAEEAVATYTPLAEQVPSAFVPPLLTSVRNLIARLVDSDQPPESNRALAGAIELLTRLGALPSGDDASSDDGAEPPE